MILELILIAVSSLLLWVYWQQKFSESAKKVNQFPGPAFWPVIGNLTNIHIRPDDLFEIFRKFAKDYKTTYRLWNANFPMINIVTADDAEIMLSSNVHIEKSRIYEFLHEWLGTGLLTSTGAKWQQRRKLLTPAFHFNILRKFVETFGEHSMKIVDDLKKECGKPKTDINPYITNTTLQAICETAMGCTLDPSNSIQKNYLESIYEIAALTVHRTVSPWMFNDFIFNLLPTGWRYHKVSEKLHHFTDNIIQEREANFKEIDVIDLDKNARDEFDAIKKKKLAMLDLLISAKIKNGTINDSGIREEVDTFMFEGHDTTSVGVSFALLLIANHKDIQERIVVELEEIFEDSKRRATYDDLQKMQYLEMCLKESLRIFPSVPLISRKITDDFKLTHATAPAGSFLNLHIYDLHRDPNVFPDPEKFDPDRFLPENVRGRNPYAYVPFSAGPRNCIGQKFAMLEMKSIISCILRNYVLEPVDKPEDIRIKIDFVLRSCNEINIKIKQRVK